MAVAAASKKKAAKKTTKKKTATKKTAKKSKKKTTKKASSKSTAPKMFDLVIVESPSKAKTIKKYLGRGFQVIASNGHIKDLPKSKLGVDVKENFAIDLVPISGKKTVLERIHKYAKDAQNIYLAPDPDREGEAIAFHLKEEIGNKKPIYRVLFNAVTKSAVTAAIEEPTELDSNKYDSQRTRRVLDRLVGYKISPILWDKVQRGLSAGRVQSVALRIIVERESEIKAFVPEQWFSIHAMLTKEGKVFEAKYYGDTATKKTDLLDEKVVKKILVDVKGADFESIDVKKRERKQNPTPPFTTSKLQQEAANKLGFTAKKTMMIAQKLYEGINLEQHGTQGLITYMRTDSVRTEPQALGEVRAFVEKRYGKDYLPAEPNLYSKKKGGSKVQDAHEAIRPTSMELEPSIIQKDLSDDEHKLYSLIWNKFVSSQMNQAVIDQTTITWNVNGHFFRSNGSVIKFPGFRSIYLEAAAEKASRRGGKDDEDEKSTPTGVLPVIDNGEKIKPKDAPNSEEHWTSPPPRFNEASLVKELEEQGIGRPSTYASIISNITDRGYVEKIDNRFVPTELGQVVCHMLIESFPDVMDVTFTAKIEGMLDDIEEGELKYKKVLKDFWTKFEVTLEKAKEEMKNLKKQEIPTGIKCRKCSDGKYLIKWGRNGRFLACSSYPECTATEDFKKHLDGTIEIIPKDYVKDPCPTCGQKMVVKKGRYGRFVACEEYPNCKTALPYTLPVHCPVCKKGKFAEKKSRYGKIFYGCTSYPDCNNAMWAFPREHDCPGCDEKIMGERQTKRDGVHLQCPKCKAKVPIEETPYWKKEASEEGTSA